MNTNTPPHVEADAPPVVKNLYRLYEVTNGNIKDYTGLELQYITSFPTQKAAVKHLKSKEFIQSVAANHPNGAEFVIITEGNHFALCPITTYQIKSLT